MRACLTVNSDMSEAYSRDCPKLNPVFIQSMASLMAALGAPELIASSLLIPSYPQPTKGGGGNPPRHSTRRPQNRQVPRSRRILDRLGWTRMRLFVPVCVCVCVCVCVRKYNKSRTGSGNTEATTGRNRAESKGGRNNGPATPVGPATRAAPSLIPLSLSLTLFHKAPPFDQRHPLCHRHHRRRPIQCPTSRAALWPPS